VLRVRVRAGVDRDADGSRCLRQHLESLAVQEGPLRHHAEIDVEEHDFGHRHGAIGRITEARHADGALADPLARHDQGVRAGTPDDAIRRLADVRQPRRAALSE
jgi:hypothetical protein